MSICMLTSYNPILYSITQHKQLRGVKLTLHIGVGAGPVTILQVPDNE